MACNGSFTPSSGTAQQASWIQSIETRLEAMETQQRLFSASVRGGAITVLNNDGARICTFGEETYGTFNGNRTVPLLAVSQPETGSLILLVDAEEGIVAPLTQVPMAIEDYKIITNSSFTSAVAGQATITGKGIWCYIPVAADASTTGEVRLNALSYQTGLTYTTDSYSLPAGTANSYQFKWDVSNNFQFNDIVRITVEAKRNTGSGNINVYLPFLFTVTPLSYLIDPQENGLVA